MKNTRPILLAIVVLLFAAGGSLVASREIFAAPASISKSTPGDTEASLLSQLPQREREVAEFNGKESGRFQAQVRQAFARMFAIERHLPAMTAVLEETVQELSEGSPTGSSEYKAMSAADREIATSIIALQLRALATCTKNGKLPPVMKPDVARVAMRFANDASITVAANAGTILSAMRDFSPGGLSDEGQKALQELLTDPDVRPLLFRMMEEQHGRDGGSTPAPGENSGVDTGGIRRSK